MCLQSNGDSGGKLRDRFQLDSCLIRVDPQLAVAFEHIRHPQNLITQLGLDVDFNEDGLVIAGMSSTPFTPTAIWVLRSRIHQHHCLGAHHFGDRIQYTTLLSVTMRCTWCLKKRLTCTWCLRKRLTCTWCLKKRLTCTWCLKKRLTSFPLCHSL